MDYCQNKKNMCVCVCVCVSVCVSVYTLSPLENLKTEMRQGILWAKYHLFIFLQIKTV